MLEKLIQFKMVLILSGILVLSLVLGDTLPLQLKSISYAVSLTIKEALIFVLPLLIFGFVFSSMVAFEKGAVRFLVLLIPMVCLSNFTSTCLAYFFGKPSLKFIDVIPLKMAEGIHLAPQWVFSLPKLIPNEIALFLGFGLGILGGFLVRDKAQALANQLLCLNMFVLNKIFVPLMPIFILGFSLKLQHEQVLVVICQNYISVFLVIFTLLVGYLIFQYGALSKFHGASWGERLRNMLPAALAGFSTMSSAAAMPLTIVGSEKNVFPPAIARSTIPATVNIHLVGDCFAIPILALAILLSFGQPLPDFNHYLVFALYFVLAKFAVAAVPGGGILVMLPILEKYFHFSPDMLSLITALYIIFDPVITSANVFGNGGFAMFFARVFGLTSRKTLAS